MKVFCLFKLYGSGDSETESELQDVFSTAKKAVENLKIPESFLKIGRNGKPNIDFAHESISMEKPYYIGSRKDCKEDVRYAHFGGFVIEETEVK